MITVPEITKPLSGNYVAVWDKYINAAIKRHTRMKVSIKNVGCEVVDPIKWKQTGKRIEKVFLFEDMPMILWANYLKPSQPVKELEKVKPMEALGGMPEKYKLQWRAKLGIKIPLDKCL
jgi:hypothetical protein